MAKAWPIDPSYFLCSRYRGDGIYVRNYSDILVNEIVYDFMRISIMDEMLRIFEVIMHISCYFVDENLSISFSISFVGYNVDDIL